MLIARSGERTTAIVRSSVGELGDEIGTLGNDLVEVTLEVAVVCTGGTWIYGRNRREEEPGVNGMNVEGFTC